MNKYQLKYNDGNKLNVIKESDIMYDILFEVWIRTHNVEGLKKLSIWMDGKVLD